MSPSPGGIMTSLAMFPLKSSLNVSSGTSPKCSKDCLYQSLFGLFYIWRNVDILPPDCLTSLNIGLQISISLEKEGKTVIQGFLKAVPKWRCNDFKQWIYHKTHMVLTFSLSSESARLRGEMVARVTSKKHVNDAIFPLEFSLLCMTENIFSRAVLLLRSKK